MPLVSISNIMNNVMPGVLNRKKFNPGSWVLTKSLEGLTDKFWDEPIAGTPTTMQMEPPDQLPA